MKEGTVYTSSLKIILHQTEESELYSIQTEDTYKLSESYFPEKCRTGPDIYIFVIYTEFVYYLCYIIFRCVKQDTRSFMAVFYINLTSRH